MAMAARAGSVDLGPDRVTGAGRPRPGAAGRPTPRRPAGAWLRAVGYDEADRRSARPVGPRRGWWPDRPVRVQHRSGHLWVLNSAGLSAGRARRRPTTGPRGRRARTDDGTADRAAGRRRRWLADRLPAPEPPDLGAVSRRLASYGVTGVTDATPTRPAADLEVLAAARRSGCAASSGCVVTGGGRVADGPGRPTGSSSGRSRSWSPTAPPDVEAGRADRPTPTGRGRPVALHCVSLVAAVLAVAAWDAAGARPGDRMEHGGVLPPDAGGPAGRRSGSPS